MPRTPPVFYSGRWNTGINPDIAFAGVGANSSLPDRRVFGSSPGHNIDLRLLHHQGLLCQCQACSLSSGLTCKLLSSIQPAELHRLGATLFLAYRKSLDPDHILCGLLGGSSDTRQKRLRSKYPFVPAAQNLLDNLARLGICTSEWTNHKWKAEYCENASNLRDFVPGTGARSVGMGLPRTAWVKLNYLQTGVGRFHSSLRKWGLAPSPNCECGASDQTAEHVLTAYLIHRAPHGARGLTVLDDKTRCWLNNITARSDPGRTATWGSKRINPRF